MRRNNNVFLVGFIRDYAERVATFNDRQTLYIDLLLQTEPPNISGEHKVMVQGQQAVELRCFLQAASPVLPQVMILGWLRSAPQEILVIAERVTVLVSSDVRQAVVAAIRQGQSEMISSSEP